MILPEGTFPWEVLSFPYFQRRFSRVASQRLFRQPICPTRCVLFGQGERAGDRWSPLRAQGRAKSKSVTVGECYR